MRGDSWVRVNAGSSGSRGAGSRVEEPEGAAGSDVPAGKDRVQHSEHELDAMAGAIDEVAERDVAAGLRKRHQSRSTRPSCRLARRPTGARTPDSTLEKNPPCPSH